MLVVALLIDRNLCVTADVTQTTDSTVEYEYYDDDEDVTSVNNVIATTTIPEIIETTTKQALNVSRRTTILSGLPHYTKGDVETTTTPIERHAYNGSRRTTIFLNPQLYADATESYATEQPVHTGRRITILSNIPSTSTSSAPSTTTTPSPPTTLNPDDNEIAATQPLNARRRTSVFTRPAIRTTTEVGIVDDNEEVLTDNDDDDNETEDEQLAATTTTLPPTTKLPLIRTTRTSTTPATTTTTTTEAEPVTTTTTATTTTTTPPPRPRTRRINLRPTHKRYETVNRFHDQEENSIRTDALNSNNFDSNEDIKQSEFLYYRDRSGLHTSVSPTSTTTVYRRPNAIIDLEHSENRKEYTQSSKRPTYATTERDDHLFSRRYARFLFRSRTG